MSETLDPVLGLPPSTWISDDLIKYSMPVVHITPSTPDFANGPSLFNLTPAMDEYNTILKTFGYDINGPTLNLAYVADNFPTDTFRNEYGPSFLDKMTDVVSGGVGDIAQMFDAKGGSEIVTKAIGEMAAQDGAMGTVGKGMQAGVNSFSNAASSLANNTGVVGKFMKDSAPFVNSMLAGHRVDFPHVWKDSGFEPSYSLTVRLYNPSPSSLKMTQKYIAGPIAAILLLGAPRIGGDNQDTYMWPFLHKIECPGIFKLDSAYISNISVIKGGDQQQIAWNQRMGIVDVRIDFGSLYNSILASSNENPNRPTIGSYIKNLEAQDASLRVSSTRHSKLGGKMPDLDQPKADKSKGSVSFDRNAAIGQAYVSRITSQAKAISSSLQSDAKAIYNELKDLF